MNYIFFLNFDGDIPKRFLNILENWELSEKPHRMHISVQLKSVSDSRL